MYLQLTRPHNTLTQFPVLVCLFAVLIIYVAPLFSQIHNALTPQSTVTIKAMAINTMAVKPMSVVNMTMEGHHHASMIAAQGNIPPHQTAHQGHLMGGECSHIMEVCGYCSLLFHLNWLDIKSVEILPLQQTRYPNLVTLPLSRKALLPLSSTHPRAPPVQNFS